MLRHQLALCRTVKGLPARRRGRPVHGQDNRAIVIASQKALRARRVGLFGLGSDPPCILRGEIVHRVWLHPHAFAGEAHDQEAIRSARA